eukprot:703165-Hanusia_phi.AAC.1
MKNSLLADVSTMGKEIVANGLTMRNYERFVKVCQTHRGKASRLFQSGRKVCKANLAFKNIIEEELHIVPLENGSGVDLERAIEFIYDDNYEELKDADELYLHIIFDACRLTSTSRKYQVYFCVNLSTTANIADYSRFTKASQQYSFAVVDGTDSEDNIDRNFLQVYAP